MRIASPLPLRASIALEPAERVPLPDVTSAPRPQPTAQVERRFVFEPVSRELVFQAIDLQRGELIRQLPDANYLRNRAYARLLAAEGRGES